MYIPAIEAGGGHMMVAMHAMAITPQEQNQRQAARIVTTMQGVGTWVMKKEVLHFLCTPG